MKSTVYFADAHAGPKRNRLEKVRLLWQKAELKKAISPGDRVAVKIHWGEPGNTGFLPPPYVRIIIEQIGAAGGRPFVTDTNTLYVGLRRNAVDNLRAAAMNGFTPETLGAPIIVADGLCGRDFRLVSLPGTAVGEAKIASAIAEADALVVLSHAKAHMLFGYAGALKNLGMGCATPAGKQVLHSDLRPRVDQNRCQGDGACLKRCPQNCIEMVPGKTAGKKVARIDQGRCIGCGECTAACPHQAIPIQWKSDPKLILRKTAEYAWAAVKDKPGKVVYMNFMILINPDCDCCDWNDLPFLPDIGFAAADDPVALDAACMDLMARAPTLPGSKAYGKDGDPLRAVYDIDYRPILDYAQELGLGQKEYQLVKL